MLWSSFENRVGRGKVIKLTSHNSYLFIILICYVICIKNSYVHITYHLELLRFIWQKIPMVFIVTLLSVFFLFCFIYVYSPLKLVFVCYLKKNVRKLSNHSNLTLSVVNIFCHWPFKGVSLLSQWCVMRYCPITVINTVCLSVWCL